MAAQAHRILVALYVQERQLYTGTKFCNGACEAAARAIWVRVCSFFMCGNLVP